MEENNINTATTLQLSEVLQQYPFLSQHVYIVPFGTGLINKTWKITDTHSNLSYILQQINTAVFKYPELIARNIESVGHFLSKHFPNYLFVQPLSTMHNKTLAKNLSGETFRLIPFVQASHTVDEVTNTHQAYQAAAQFGKFTFLLHHFPVDSLSITLPDFHNLSFRQSQFENALHSAQPDTFQQAKTEINQLTYYGYITGIYEKMIGEKQVPLRAIHHDTKISNCLFDTQEKGLCVVDLDTLMPGYFISDLGDMFRSYLCLQNEESKAFEDIEIRVDFFEAIIAGYFSEMGKVLTKNELAFVIYSGKFLIYMQALRFLTDFLNGNPYYPVHYPLHNLHRAKNQIALLNDYCKREPDLQKIVKRHVS